MRNKIKVTYYGYCAEFRFAQGKGWLKEPFYVCGNAGVAEEFTDALKAIGCDVTVEQAEGEDESL